MTKPQSVDSVINQLANIVKPLVASIERSDPITKDHYDQYMRAINKLADMLGGNQNASVYLGIGVAMQRAGANKNGVQSALRAMGRL